jgi:uncharacterized phage-like protein YoqJ
LERLVVLACRFLIWAKPAKVITGMALGWDTAVALACVRCNVPFIAAIPFEGQDYTWPHDARSRYKTLRRWAAEEVIVSLGGYTPGLMHARNRWMVDRCEAVMAVWNASITRNKYSGRWSIYGLTLLHRWLN